MPRRIEASEYDHAIDVQCPHCGDIWNVVPNVARLIITDGCSSCWIAAAEIYRQQLREE